jgi:hypothetical protein
MQKIFLPSFTASRRLSGRTRSASRIRLASGITTIFTIRTCITSARLASRRSWTRSGTRARSRGRRRTSAATRRRTTARGRRRASTTTRGRTASRLGRRTRATRRTATTTSILINYIKVNYHFLSLIINFLTSRRVTRWPFNSRSFNFLRAYSISSRTANSTILYSNKG